MTLATLADVPGMQTAEIDQLRAAAAQLSLTGRAQLAIAKVARTLADLEQRSLIQSSDIAHAIGLRASPHEA